MDPGLGGNGLDLKGGLIVVFGAKFFFGSSNFWANAATEFFSVGLEDCDITGFADVGRSFFILNVLLSVLFARHPDCSWLFKLFLEVISLELISLWAGVCTNDKAVLLKSNVWQSS